MSKRYVPLFSLIALATACQSVPKGALLPVKGKDRMMIENLFLEVKKSLIDQDETAENCHPARYSSKDELIVRDVAVMDASNIISGQLDGFRNFALIVASKDQTTYSISVEVANDRCVEFAIHYLVE